MTKCTLADPVLSQAAMAEGAALFADSRLLNMERLPQGLPRLMLRIGCPEEAEDIVRQADISLQSEIATIRALGQAARSQGRRHKVVLMIDLGDLREGIFFENTQGILDAAEAVVREEGLELYGVGTNLTCFGGIMPSRENLAGGGHQPADRGKHPPWHGHGPRRALGRAAAGRVHPTGEAGGGAA